MAQYKKEAYSQAFALRRRGFTYSEIAKFCNVSKGTVSNWLRAEPFSQSIATDNRQRAVKDNVKRLRALNKARQTERTRQYAEAVRTADVEYKHYRHTPLFIAGLTLYLSLGDTRHPSVIRVSSRRSEHHAVLIRFLVEFLAVRKTDIRCWLLLYPEHDEVTCLQHWSKKIGLSVAQFNKSQYVAARSTKAALHFGVGNTIIGSTLHKKKLLRWLKLLQKDIAK